MLLSGPASVGKSTLVLHLVERWGAATVSTRAVLKDKFGSDLDRLELRRAGAALDEQTGGAWVADATAERFGGSDIVVVDAVRRLEQVRAVRDACGREGSVVHVHLAASEEVGAERHARQRSDRPGETLSYSAVRADPVEAGVAQLAAHADHVINTDRSTAEDVAVRVEGALGLRSRRPLGCVDVLVGGQYGSEGKGNISGYLAKEYDVLVRGGGPNAGHTVWTPEGRRVQHHLPSGTTVSDAQLVLGPGAVINPGKLLEEIARSNVVPGRLAIDPQASVITRRNIRQEAKLSRRIGSTQSGVGAATADRIMRRGHPRHRLAGDVDALRPFIRPTADVLDRALADGGRVFVEGTQGTGLSLLHAAYPYVTSRDTTVGALLAEAGLPPARLRRTIMVCRTYPIRVQSPRKGSSGWMSQETTWQEVARRSGLPLEPLLEQEITTTTRRKRRVAEFDWTQLLRSAQLNGPTDIAVTFTDQLSAGNGAARAFEELHARTQDFINEVERVAGAPVTLISTGFSEHSVIDRRDWP